MGARRDPKGGDPGDGGFAALRQAVIALAEDRPRNGALQDDSLEDALSRIQTRLTPEAAGVSPPVEPARVDRRKGQRFFVMARADRFEALGSRVGERVADGVLAALCERIRATAPDTRLGRIGRGLIDFTFAAPDSAAAEAALNALHDRLEKPVDVEGEAFTLPITIGASPIDNERSVVQACHQAEQALVEAEAIGAKLAIFCRKKRADASKRLRLMRDLRAGLASNQFSLAYQPKLNLRTNEIEAVEALVRWTHPVRGNIPPDAFIALAEDTGDIRRITETVLTFAIEDQARFAKMGVKLCTYINLSGRLVTDEAFCRWLIQTCAGVPGRIGVEITETVVIADPDRALRNLRSIADAGIGIAIDDYGSGVSSLAYMKALPANELKIDKAFVQSLSSSHRDPLIVRSTIDLAHALEMEVTAEGVEDPTALALLRVMGCDRAQGYLIARPLAFDDLLAFLREHREGRRDDSRLAHPLLSLSRARRR